MLFFERSQKGPHSPIIVRIVIGLHNAYFEDTNIILSSVTLMAHEMIHFYCFLHNIEDTDPNGYHNEHFLQAAESHGMYCKQHDSKNGYSGVLLTYEQIDKVFARIPDKIWDAVTHNIKFINVRKSIQKFLVLNGPRGKTDG